jgi:hypothetical protein
MKFGAGERILSDWMNQNAFVCWLEHLGPWEMETELSQKPPLETSRKARTTRSTENSRKRRRPAQRPRSITRCDDLTSLRCGEVALVVPVFSSRT